jgi:BlaI family penicillinase repressor
MEIRFTGRELDIMKVLWAQGPSTVAAVRDALEDDLAHTTVLTMLKVMEGKGYVSRRPSDGRGHCYAAEVERAVAGDSALSRLTERLFGGSPEELFMHLVDSGLTEDELRRMRDLLDERLGDEEDER